MKYKVKTKDCHLILKAKTSFGESIDEKELERFMRTYLRGFLKAKNIKKNSAEYVGPVGISLYERLKKPMGKREFLFVMEHIVAALQKLEANNLPVKNLVLDIQNVYINETTKELQFLYLPLTKESTTANIMEFAETIIYSVIPEEKEDAEMVSNFSYFLKGHETFDVEKTERYIAKMDAGVVNTIKKYNVGQSGFMTDKQQDYYAHVNARSREDEDATALLEDDEKTGLLNEEATDLLLDEVTELLDESEDTMILVEEVCDVKFQTCPKLRRVLTEEVINIDKPVFRLGKETSYVDYCVTNNGAVSRSHADIVIRSGKCFIKDLDSKNRTFVNDQPIPAQCEIEICEGDRIKLANEEFIFFR